MDPNPRLEWERVGTQWLVTSPDVPGLNVAHPDLDAAIRAVPHALQMLRSMAERRAEKDRLEKRFAACA